MENSSIERGIDFVDKHLEECQKPICTCVFNMFAMKKLLESMRVKRPAKYQACSDCGEIICQCFKQD